MFAPIFLIHGNSYFRRFRIGGAAFWPQTPQGCLSPLRYRKCPPDIYFTSSYIIGTGYQDFPFLWYNYGTKTRFLLHFLTGNTFKKLSSDIATRKHNSP